MQKSEFPQKVMVLRGALGLTQEAFAKKIDVSKRSVSAWETGELIPKKTVRIKMAVICGLPVSEFLFDDELVQKTTETSQPQTDQYNFLERLGKSFRED